MHFSLYAAVPAAILATIVSASGATIVASIDDITAKTVTLNSSLASWTGDFIGVFAILSASNALTSSISSGSDTASASKPLTQTEALTLVNPATLLVDDVKSVLNTLVAAKPKFDALFIASPIVLQILKNDKTKADNFTTIIVSKVPTVLQSVAKNIVAPIDPAFIDAIANYTTVPSKE